MGSIFKRKGIIIAVILISVLAAPVVSWLASPLFINTRVSEDFPLSASAILPSDMSRKEAEKQISDAAKVETRTDEKMPSSASTVLFSGSFTDADSFHKGRGKAELHRLSDGKLVLRLDEFQVTNGPDLRVLLTKHSDPRTTEDVHQGYEEVDKLKGNIGSQNYEIRSSLNLEEYKAVVIYCKPFQVVFSVASLKKA
ncbi:MAG: hypothetical protein EXR50_02960 [Dehalococcoidia bacterium]|nr:hypothetical protein [Dehalococcoidia bacterium]